MNQEFWEYMQRLVDSSTIRIDRPKGSTHPRFPQQVYPVSYGYLEGTNAMDSGGVDIWVGSLKNHRVVGALCTVDLLKRDTELKIMYDCSDEEINTILKFVNVAQMRAEFLKRET
jgi:inorganic pyrophosphatase